MKERLPVGTLQGLGTLPWEKKKYALRTALAAWVLRDSGFGLRVSVRGEGGGDPGSLLETRACFVFILPLVFVNLCNVGQRQSFLHDDEER